MGEAKILVVDDKGFTRVNLSRCLSQGGYSVTEASSCMEGFHLLSTSPFDLVIVDHSMSDMNGLQFHEAACSIGCVNEIASSPKPTFILISDLIETDLVKTAWEQGFRHVLSKSVDREHLLGILKDCVGPNNRAGPCKGDEPDRIGKGMPSQCHHLIEFEKSTGEEGLVRYRLRGTLSQGSGFAGLVESVVGEAQTKGSKLIFDLEAVSYVNSSGIAGLVQLHKKIAALGGEMSLVNAQPQVVRVLHNLDLLQLFHYKHNQEAEPVTCPAPVEEAQPETEIEPEGTSVQPD